MSEDRISRTNEALNALAEASGESWRALRDGSVRIQEQSFRFGGFR